MKLIISIIIFFHSNKSFHEESLIDETWDGKVTTWEEKETYPMLSVHLCGGQFKRERISVFFAICIFRM